jgi:hypothetical protein
MAQTAATFTCVCALVAKVVRRGSDTRMSDATILCIRTGTTASDLHGWLRAHDRDKIADFLQARFEERYFAPILSMNPEQKHGFLIMAICCLTIEALECFRHGWRSTDKKTKDAFKAFLTQEPRFAVFSPYVDSFYKGVRCGILHQGETYRGWKIRRGGPLLDDNTLSVNASRFHLELQRVLADYVKELKGSDFKSKLWKQARKKLTDLVANCEKKELSDDE